MQSLATGNSGRDCAPLEATMHIIAAIVIVYALAKLANIVLYIKG